jgi:thiosulfate/3-mercaptopyruvate sulfurtransferase
MKNKTLTVISFGFLMILGLATISKEGDPWKTSQLLQPSELVKTMKEQSASQPIIFNIGFVNDVPGAINIGSINEPENKKKFNAHLKDLKKDAPIVIYCGCCPFKNCPNVRPAFAHLNELGFKNHNLLNLPVSLKADWIDKGYPLSK